MAYAICQLPAQDIPAAIDNELADQVDKWINDKNNYQKLLTFLAYMRRQWKPIADVVSVYKKPQMIVTSNTCENFHLWGQKYNGIYPNCWEMISKLSMDRITENSITANNSNRLFAGKLGFLIKKSEENYKKLISGIRLECPRPRNLVEADTAVMLAENNYELQG